MVAKAPDPAPCPHPVHPHCSFLPCIPPCHMPPTICPLSHPPPSPVYILLHFCCISGAVSSNGGPSPAQPSQEEAVATPRWARPRLEEPEKRTRNGGGGGDGQDGQAVLFSLHSLGWTHRFPATLQIYPVVSSGCEAPPLPKEPPQLRASGSSALASSLSLGPKQELTCHLSQDSTWIPNEAFFPSMLVQGRGGGTGEGDTHLSWFWVNIGIKKLLHVRHRLRA